MGFVCSFIGTNLYTTALSVIKSDEVYLVYVY